MPAKHRYRLRWRLRKKCSIDCSFQECSEHPILDESFAPINVRPALARVGVLPELVWCPPGVCLMYSRIPAYENFDEPIQVERIQLPLLLVRCAMSFPRYSYGNRQHYSQRVLERRCNHVGLCHGIRLCPSGCTLVLQIAQYAHTCKGKGEQKEKTAALDAAVLEGARALLSAQELTIQTSYQDVSARSFLASAKIPAVSDEAFRSELRARCFLQPFAQGKCALCKAVTMPYHAHNACKKNSERVILRHDRIKKILSNYAERRFIVRVEPSGLRRETRERPDLLIALPGETLAVDIAVAFVGSVAGPRHINDVARAKSNAWTAPLQERGISFLPFVVGHTGQFDCAAEETLTLLVPDVQERALCRAEIIAAIAEGNGGMQAACRPRRA